MSRLAGTPQRALPWLYAAAATVTVAGAVSGRQRWQRWSKPALAPLLAAHTADPLVRTGLAAATVGDVILLEPDEDRHLVHGAAAFAAMQSAYIAALLQRSARPTAVALVPRLLAWAGAGALLRARAPQLAGPLLGYGLLLGTTMTLASDPALDRRLWWGAQLFTASDGLIVMRRLLIRDERARRIAEGAVLATYAGAQYLLVTGMTRAR